MVGNPAPDIVEAFYPSLEFGKASWTWLSAKVSEVSPLSTPVTAEIPIVPAHVVPSSATFVSVLENRNLWQSWEPWHPPSYILDTP